MKFGVAYNTASLGMDPDHLIGIARHAERLGYEAFYLPEHIALHPGAELGGNPIPPDLVIADPLECLSFVAAGTERILLGTAVLLLPYHDPVVLAKRLATIDVLSRGRMRLFGIGVGSLPGEAAAIGADYHTRGRRADEAIDVLRLLWAGDASGVSFDGEFFKLVDACSYPKPYEAGTLPIHVGGGSAAAARRAGGRGDGLFLGGRLTPAQQAELLELARDRFTARGRAVEEFECTRWGSTALTPGAVERYEAAGVTRIVVQVGSPDLDEARRDLEAFATLQQIS